MQGGADALFSGANKDLHKEEPDRAYMARSAGSSQREAAVNSRLPESVVAP